MAKAPSAEMAAGSHDARRSFTSTSLFDRQALEGASGVCTHWSLSILFDSERRGNAFVWLPDWNSASPPTPHRPIKRGSFCFFSLYSACIPCANIRLQKLDPGDIVVLSLGNWSAVHVTRRQRASVLDLPSQILDQNAKARLARLVNATAPHRCDIFWIAPFPVPYKLNQA